LERIIIGALPGGLIHLGMKLPNYNLNKLVEDTALEIGKNALYFVAAYYLLNNNVPY